MEVKQLQNLHAAGIFLTMKSGPNTESFYGWQRNNDSKDDCNNEVIVKLNWGPEGVQ